MPAHDPKTRTKVARTAALKRHRPADDPAISDAERDLRAARLEHHIRSTVQTWPPLTADQRDALASLLTGGGRLA